jgi:hypothetical protein
MKLAAGAGDDVLAVTAESFFDVFVDFDLGTGDDKADLTYVGGGSPDPTADGSVRFIGHTGDGDDIVNITGARFFDVFVDLDLGAGDDQALVDFPATATAIPGKVRELDFAVVGGTGDDAVKLNASGFFDVFAHLDLGAGDDMADLNYVGGGAPDPAGKVREASLNLLGGSGNDTIEAAIAAFFQIDVQANLGAGDDQFALTLSPDPLPVEDLASIVNVLIDAGSGIDDVVLDVQHVSLDEVLESVLIMGVGLVSVATLFPIGLVRIEQAARDSRVGEQAQFSLTWDGLNAAIDVRTGVSDDLIQLEIDPAADGSVRFSADTGDGDDRVSLIGSRLFEQVVTVDLGAGDDQFDLTGVAAGVGPSCLELNVVAGLGDDVVNVASSSFFDIVFEIDLGDGDDQAHVDIPPDPQTIPGKVRELRATIVGGAGDDVAHSCIPMSLFDVLLDIDLGSGDDAALLELEGQFLAVPPAESRSLRATVATAAGNDDVQILIGLLPPFTTQPASDVPLPAAPPAVAFDVFLDVDLGSGDDHFMFDILPDSSSIAGKVRELHLTIDAGAGNDIVQDCEPGIITADAFIDIDLGAGDDTFMLEQRLALATLAAAEPQTLRRRINAGSGHDDVQVLIGYGSTAAVSLRTRAAVMALSVLELILDIDLGAGNDEFSGQFFTPSGAAAFGGASHLTVLGQQGNDTIDLQLGRLGSGAPLMVNGFFELNMDGGAGADTILCSNNLNIAPGSRVSLRAAGGIGNDRIDAFFQLVAESNGALLAQLLGGRGDDRLSLIARALSPPRPTLLDLLVDGGAGFDRAQVTRNVTVKKCERTTTVR